MSTDNDFQNLVSAQIAQTQALMDHISVEQSKLAAGDDPTIAGCFGSAGTFGCGGGCFGCAGTFGCYVQASVSDNN
jgi:hypothetical protein